VIAAFVLLHFSIAKSSFKYKVSFCLGVTPFLFDTEKLFLLLVVLFEEVADLIYLFYSLPPFIV
jgi:hypothetical protein